MYNNNNSNNSTHTPKPTRTHTHENLSHSPLWHNGERGSEKMSYFNKTNSDYNFWFEFLEELLINNYLNQPIGSVSCLMHVVGFTAMNQLLALSNPNAIIYF